MNSIDPANPPTAPLVSPPVVSIAMAAYNREAYVAAAVGSVLSQTFSNFELIVHDDGSSDGTVAAARQRAGGDPRVRVVAGSHRGVAATLNAAFGEARGKYFGWIDSDDALAPTALAETVSYLDAHPDAGVVYTQYLTMDEDGTVRGLGKRTDVPYSSERLLVDFMTFQFRLMRREVFEAVGGLDEQLGCPEDYDFCLRVSEFASFHHLARPLYLYRIHDRSISSQNRLAQIESSSASIRRALARRGLDAEYELKVELIGRFSLKKKR
jgi:glycosyltransferase involved in cell wall biosynthesis